MDAKFHSWGAFAESHWHITDTHHVMSGVRVDRAADIGEAVRKGIAANKPYLIDVNINADQNPGGAGVWELPGLGVSKVAIGGRYQP